MLTNPTFRFITLTSLLTLLVIGLRAQRQTEKLDQAGIQKLKQDIEFLSSPKCEGRMAGSHGERMAAEYIQQRFMQLNLQPFIKESLMSEFFIKEGFKIMSKAYFKINQQALELGKEVKQLPYSQGDRVNGLAMPFVNEPDNVWMISLKSTLNGVVGSPFKAIYEQAREADSLGANAVVFFNDITVAQDISLDKHPQMDALELPVLMISYAAYLKHIKPHLRKDWIDVDARLGYEESNLTAHNVVGYINNQAQQTVIITATYDHLGRNGVHYPGANYNASGIASLLGLAELITQQKLKNYNYLFVALSGSHYDQAGVQALLKSMDTKLNQVSYVLELDRLGRYNSLTRFLYVQGTGTSTAWYDILNRQNKTFVIKAEPSGLGFNAISWFYKKSIPGLHFSTGYTRDQHRVEDEPGKINYTALLDINQFLFRIIADLDRSPKPMFTETVNPYEKLLGLKTNLGIIPDLTYGEDGLKVASCLWQKAADKAGIEPEDVIIRIAEFEIIDLDDYVKALTKLPKGREVGITVRRGEQEFRYFVGL